MTKKILLIATLVFTLDQISKAVINITMSVGTSICVIPDFFYLTYYQNSGAAWGILKSKQLFLSIISIIMLIIIYHYMYSFKRNKRNTLAFGLLIGGILGNLLDRLIFGYVKDFLHFYIFDYSFPIFNISDIAIVIGIFLIIIAVLKGEEVNGRNKSNKRRTSG